VAVVELRRLLEDEPGCLLQEGLVLRPAVMLHDVCREPGGPYRPHDVGRSLIDERRVAPQVRVVVQHEALVAPVHGLSDGLARRVVMLIKSTSASRPGS